MVKDVKSRASKRPRSLLSRGPRILLAVSIFLAVFMLANTLYLLLNRAADASDLTFFAVGKTSLPEIFQVMVLSHTGVGLLLASLFVAFMIWHLPHVWRRRKWRSLSSGIALIVATIALAVTGLFIMTAAASEENAWIWYLHVALAAVGPLAYVFHRIYSVTRPSSAAYNRFGIALAVMLVVIVGIHLASPKGLKLTDEARIAREKGLDQGPGGTNRDVAAFAKTDFVPAAFVPPESPFFPSAATTSSGDYLPSRIITRDDLGKADQFQKDLDEYGFVVHEEIGADTCGRCHPDVVEQWSKSAHRFASFNNPFYEATINDMRENATEINPWIVEHAKTYAGADERVGMVKSKWCSGCHDPSLMLAGKMDKPIDRSTPQAQAGLTCLACHAIDKIHNNTGNAAYNIADEQEDPYLFADASDGLGAWLHDTALKAKPTVHKRQMLTEDFHQSEFCATCHKVSLNDTFNNYRWLRGQNEYDNWHDSGVALNAARTFYLPGANRECQDCHMPLEDAPLGDVSARNGKVRSHRFLAVNTALPFIRGDEDTIRRTEEFLQDNKLRVEIFAAHIEGLDEPVLAIADSEPALTAGRRVQFDVVVRNLNVGHTFPGGTNDSNEGWLEFVLEDSDGNKLYWSGRIQEDGHLDPHAHVYKIIVLDKHGDPIHRRNAQDIHVPVLVNVVGPGTADIARYSVSIPPELEGSSVTVRARLLWRKFDRKYTEFAYNTNPQGFKMFDAVPDLPVTEIASHEVTLPVTPPDAQRVYETVTDPEHWVRFNDYGIGLILQGDTVGAERAFEWVKQLQPDKLDGHRNLARVAIRDGDIEEAYGFLQDCENITPGDQQTAWVWGVAAQEDGRYEEAAGAYRRVLTKFPEDRATWRNLGRVYYLDGEYEKALEAFAEVLAIDPEDRVAHYHRMLCLRALGRDAEADLASDAYEYYQIDENAQKLTQQYRIENPAVQLETQPLHIHELEPLYDTAVRSAASAPENDGTKG